MPERKVKCASCGKWFKANDYKTVKCPACLSAERAKRRLAAHQMADGALPRVATGRAAPAVAAPGTSAPPGPLAPLPVSAARPVAPSGARPGRRPATGPLAPPRRPGPPPFVLTAEHRAAIERRYLELATPREFDGIRSQIASELSLPRVAVRMVILDVRKRLGLPSWWDLQQVSLTPDQVEQVRARYAALLPLPPIGVHKQIAAELQVSNLQVYRAIGQIRQEMHLPAYNDRPDVPGPVAPVPSPDGVASGLPAASAT